MNIHTYILTYLLTIAYIHTYTYIYANISVHIRTHHLYFYQYIHMCTHLHINVLFCLCCHIVRLITSRRGFPSSSSSASRAPNSWVLGWDTVAAKFAVLGSGLRPHPCRRLCSMFVFVASFFRRTLQESLPVAPSSYHFREYPQRVQIECH